MYTLGYGFKPWTAAKAIADGPSIRGYIRDTARATASTATSASGTRWCARRGRARTPAGPSRPSMTATSGTIRTCARFLYMCSGYYSYDQPTARLRGAKTLTWAASSSRSSGRRTSTTRQAVVVIGSGATAVTLVPAMAETGRHVTMLQRSPTYVVSRPSEYRFARRLQRRWLPEKAAYWATRWRVIAESMLLYRMARSKPELAKQKIVAMAQHQLGPDFDVDTHFTPSYKPWDQRVCVVPDGDLFKAIRKGQARWSPTTSRASPTPASC
jgi:monooxygenase